MDSALDALKVTANKNMFGGRMCYKTPSITDEMLGITIVIGVNGNSGVMGNLPRGSSTPNTRFGTS